MGQGSIQADTAQEKELGVLHLDPWGTGRELRFEHIRLCPEYGGGERTTDSLKFASSNQMRVPAGRREVGMELQP